MRRERKQQNTKSVYNALQPPSFFLPRVQYLFSLSILRQRRTTSRTRLILFRDSLSYIVLLVVSFSPLLFLLFPLSSLFCRRRRRRNLSLSLTARRAPLTRRYPPSSRFSVTRSSRVSLSLESLVFSPLLPPVCVAHLPLLLPHHRSLYRFWLYAICIHVHIAGAPSHARTHTCVCARAARVCIYITRACVSRAGSTRGARDICT